MTPWLTSAGLNARKMRQSVPRRSVDLRSRFRDLTALPPATRRGTSDAGGRSSACRPRRKRTATRHGQARRNRTLGGRSTDREIPPTPFFHPSTAVGSPLSVWCWSTFYIIPRTIGSDIRRQWVRQRQKMGPEPQ